jgi:hypothetical protein
VRCSDEACERGRATAGEVDRAVAVVFLKTGIRGERSASLMAAT